MNNNALKTKTKRKVIAERSPIWRLSEKAKHPRNWNGALIHNEKFFRTVSVDAMGGDESLRPADSEILWTVRVQVDYREKAESLYAVNKTAPTPAIVLPTESASVLIEIGHARGSEEPAREYRIKCEMGHLDLLVEALTSALVIGRRDGILPIARGIRPTTRRDDTGQRGPLRFIKPKKR